jgi:LSD1 subclass zinc finger protein
MVLYGELVCAGCSEVLSYPLGAISCRCQRCRTVNPSQHIRFSCPGCSHELLAPVNTIEALCPVCTAIIEIPLELLPPVPKPAEAMNAAADASPLASMYVEEPALSHDGKALKATAIATQIM